MTCELGMYNQWRCYFYQVLSFYIKINLVSHYEINTMKKQWTGYSENQIYSTYLREVEAYYDS